MATFAGQENRFKLYHADSIPQIVYPALINTEGKAGYTLVTLDGSVIRTEYYERGNVDPIEDFRIDTSNRVWMGYAEGVTIKRQQGMLPLNMVADKVISENASIFTGLTIGAGCFVYGTSSGELICREEQSGEIRWKKNFLAALYSTPLIAEGKVIVGLPNSRIAEIGRAHV